MNKIMNQKMFSWMLQKEIILIDLGKVGNAKVFHFVKQLSHVNKQMWARLYIVVSWWLANR